jgi:CubicO group peptidase (beta-lactamase class C family)
MICKSTHLLFFALLLVSCDATRKDAVAWHKKPLAIAAPESAGFSSERLQRIDTVFRKFVDQHKINGVTALVARKGKIVYYKTTGFDDIEKQTALQKDAIFRIASQSKAITSVAVMMLCEEGKISLNDPVSLYLPEFSDARIVATFSKKDSTYSSRPAKRQVTIHDLLTHTSGYCYPGNGSNEVNAIYVKNRIMNGVPSLVSTLQNEMKKIATVPLVHEPGERFTYGLSTDILGYLVETVSGQSLDEFFRTRIFVPLEMKDTYFRLPGEKASRLMQLYQDGENGEGIQKSTGQYTDYPIRDGIYFSGGGGLSSTAMDFAIFEQMLLNGGEYNGVRLLGRKSVQMMTRNQIGDLASGTLFIPGGTGKFGLGFEVICAPGSALTPLSEGSFGWGGAFGSLYWIDPAEDMVALLVIQTEGEYNNIRNKFIAMVYAALETD